MRLFITTAVALLAAATTSHAQESCAVDGDAWDLDETGVNALYDCMSERMVAAYTKEGDAVAAAYRDWTPGSVRPAVAGPHGERLLNTFVNEVGAEQYLQYEYGDFAMPVGSVIAKESMAVREGTGRVGPLFVMTKSDDAAAAEYGGWVYSGVQPNGKPLKISQAFCHDCHQGFADSDSMGYPLDEVRVPAQEAALAE